MSLATMEREDEVLKAFSKVWADWKPHRLYNPIRVEEVAEASRLPAKQVDAALGDLVEKRVLARRGAVEPGAGTSWMYEFTEAGIRKAVKEGYLRKSDVPTLSE